MMRQDRFTEGAQEVLAASQEMVRNERHSQWDVEHVLMALLTYEKGITPQIFELLNVDVPRVRQSVGRALSGAPKLAYDVVQIYTTPRIVRMLEAANAEAERLKELKAMSVPALKKLAQKVSKATGTKLPEGGKGAQARLVTYIAKHTE